ncbi:hypothetical protein [Kitasatospora sp. NPDC058046]|uniref:hypothetical protein n=1 Tax=Kitasatospora sp. NPDC058046 TaxID=3346312 RepID=UPI0036DB043A
MLPHDQCGSAGIVVTSFRYTGVPSAIARSSSSRATLSPDSTGLSGSHTASFEFTANSSISISS